MFDACRSELKLPVRGDKGFVPVSNFGGMLTAFSASPGQVASDGAPTEDAGPYARALASELDRAQDEGVGAASLFSRVRLALRRAGEAQEPIYQDGLDKAVTFGAIASADEASAPQKTTPLASREAAAKLAYDAAESIGTTHAFRDVAELYQDTFWGRQASREAERLEREAEDAERQAAAEERRRREEAAARLEAERQEAEAAARQAEERRRQEAEAEAKAAAEALRQERAARWEALKDGRDVAALESFAADPTAPFSEDAAALLEAHYRDAQTALATLGLYAIRIDGDWGPSSRRALTAFQQSQGVSPTDGALTEALLGALTLAASEAEQKAEAEARLREEARRREASSSARQPGETFRDCPECPEMVVIPGGSFTMGSPTSEPERRDAEGPQRTVRIAPFAMGKYEVMFAEWDACVAAGGCSRRPDDNGWGRGRRPVINVSWNDAQEYVAWLNSRVSGAPYRLPSEAEWEYAARARTTTPFWTGARITTDQANFNGNSTYNGSAKGVYRRQTVPVGSFAANPWGLHDVHGNVFELVQDCLNRSYSGAPSHGSAWVSGDCSAAVLRGGSWNDNPRSLRSAFRNWDVRGGLFVGFRVARTLN